MDTNQYMGMFLEESREHLQTLNSCLLELESNFENLSVLNEIFRSAHTIKGMSATMGFTTIAELTHEMESVLDLLRKGQMQPSAQIVDLVFRCVDTLEQLVESVSSQEDCSLDIQPLLDELGRVGKQQLSMPAVLCVDEVKQTTAVILPPPLVLNETEAVLVEAAEAAGMQALEIHVGLRESCLIKSVRAYMVISALEEFGEIIKCMPGADELEKENFELEFSVVLLTCVLSEKVRQTLLGISEVESVDVGVCHPSLQAVRLQPPERPASGGAEVVDAKKAKPSPGANGNGDRKMKSGQSVRVDIEKLDALLNLVGELVINKTRLEQIGLTHRLAELIETIEQMDRVTTDLQNVVMKVRMVPVGQVFNRFPRMIRDLSRGLHKEINLVIQGEETELDRTVIDEIGDPLVHLLRNAVDHGIEQPDVRQAKGKNAVGEVRLIAKHEGNNVIIEVEDDGKGIPAEIIKQKAVAKGLLSQDDADKMDDGDAVRLVFLAGFSTADVLTDVSGRGVGMDVVKSKIESLGGMVDVETRPDAGSKFKIRLPLTLAIIQALMVRVHAEIYAIPLGSIDSTISIAAGDIKTVGDQEVALLRGEIIPIIRLAGVLNASPVVQTVGEELFVVIVHMGERKAGVIVDNLIGQQDIVIKSLGRMLAGIKVIAGATILGNGQVALILDIGALMQRN